MNIKNLLKWIVILGALIGVLFFVTWFYKGNPSAPKEAYAAWDTYTDIQTGLSFKYPPKLPTEYITALDWPPQIQVLNQTFACVEGGSETARAGETVKKTVGSKTYCVTKVTEGAAGSIYTMYAYAFPMDDKTIILTFSTRAVQCANYDNPQKASCENERTSFNIDEITDLIAQSLK